MASTSPENRVGSRAVTVRVSASVSASRTSSSAVSASIWEVVTALTLSPVTDHHPTDRSSASSRTSPTVWKDPAASVRDAPSSASSAACRSSGASLPPEADSHAAVRNSWLVATRSCARARTFSGSSTTVMEPSGSRDMSWTISSASSGASDSMPSTYCPPAIRSRISRPPGSCSLSLAARDCTDGVMSSSRHGGATITDGCSASVSVRWSATANHRISSSSSPKNSARTGWSSVGGKTSMMPPRTANSPRRVTMSTREYAAPARRATSCWKSYSWPVRSVTGFMAPSPATTGCSTERTGATTTRSGCSPSCAWSRRRSTLNR